MAVGWRGKAGAGGDALDGEGGDALDSARPRRLKLAARGEACGSGCRGIAGAHIAWRMALLAAPRLAFHTRYHRYNSHFQCERRRCEPRLIVWSQLTGGCVDE
jgi:hypothetical protein